jgi:hypothetical protein
MISPETWKMIHDEVKGAWAVVGPLVRVLIGAYIANRNERRHWLRDNQRLEWRELLSTMAWAYSTIVNINSRPYRDKDGENQSEAARLESLNVLRDRIFIAATLRNLDLVNKWNKAVRNFRAKSDYELFAVEFSEIIGLLRRNAKLLLKD